MNMNIPSHVGFMVALMLLPKVLLSETSVGVGLGPLYNGLGINISKPIKSSRYFGAVGCVGFSTSTQINRSDSALAERNSSHSTNCGFGIGFISTTPLSGFRQSLGVTLGLNYNTEYNRLEYSLTPMFVYFMKGIEHRGFNVGFGTPFTFRNEDPVDIGFMLNLGFQF